MSDELLPHLIGIYFDAVRLYKELICIDVRAIRIPEAIVCLLVKCIAAVAFYCYWQ